MRVGIFSDVHGNLQALEATLSSLEHRRVDQLLCLGDIATLGLQPREVINRLEKMDCKILLGNHESALLFPEKHEQFGIPKFLFPTIQWCLDQIGDFGLNFIKTFAMTEKIILNEFYSLLAFHGTPTSNFEIFDLYNDDSISETQMFFPNTNVFAGGHTHMQILQRSKTFTFINPGSAGSVFSGGPRWLVKISRMISDNHAASSATGFP